MLGADHRGLHKEKISACLRDRLAEPDGRHRRGAHGGNAPLGLDFANAKPDKVLTHRLAVELLHQRHKLLFAHRSDAIENRIGVLVAALHPLQVQHAQGT